MRQTLQSAAAKHADLPSCPPEIGPRAADDLETGVAWDWLRDAVATPCGFGGVFQVRLISYCACRQSCCDHDHRRY